MTPKDALLFEDIVMALAAYVHSVALALPGGRDADLSYEEFKTRAGRLFGKWHEPE